MNEQQQADALAEQLDALLTGETPTSSLPAELADLLHLAGQLSAAAPTPRPEFGAALKASLLESAAAPTVSGISLTGNIVLLVMGGIVIVLVALALLAGTFVANPATPTPENNPTPVTIPDSEPVAPAISPAEASPAPPQPTITNRAADTLRLPTPLPQVTVILDILPSITVTVELAGEEISLPELLPGQPSSSNNDKDDGGSGSGGGQSSDANQGQGQDSDSDDDDD